MNDISPSVMAALLMNHIDQNYCYHILFFGYQIKKPPIIRGFFIVGIIRLVFYDTHGRARISIVDHKQVVSIRQRFHVEYDGVAARYANYILLKRSAACDVTDAELGVLCF